MAFQTEAYTPSSNLAMNLQKIPLEDSACESKSVALGDSGGSSLSFRGPLGRGRKVLQRLCLDAEAHEPQGSNSWQAEGIFAW